jgi:beta-glucosidase
VLGLNDEWESEGYDRKSMELPGAQDKLVWRLLKDSGNPEKIIVVNQSGSPVHMPWAEEVSTILQAWYGGQEAGNALWDVLTGDVNPSGRLPISWPKEYLDLRFEEENWPGVDGIVKYEEGNNVGYRWFQYQNLESRWWFGYGLSYTVFQIRDLKVRECLDGWEIEVSVENVGALTGREVVQVYTCGFERSGKKRTLAAFGKTKVIKPGEKVRVKMVIKYRDLALWKPEVDRGRWVTEAGSSLISVARNSGDTNMLECQIGTPSRKSWRP